MHQNSLHILILDAYHVNKLHATITAAGPFAKNAAASHKHENAVNSPQDNANREKQGQVDAVLVIWSRLTRKTMHNKKEKRGRTRDERRQEAIGNGDEGWRKIMRYRTGVFFFFI